MAMFRYIRRSLATDPSQLGDGPSRLAIVSAGCITVALIAFLFAGS